MSLTSGFALIDTDNSKDFADALYNVAGDGVTPQGGRFNLSVNGFTASLSSGYALAAGRWIANDEPIPIYISPPGNNEDRVDAIAVRVDYEARKASLEVLLDVDPVAIKANPSLLRDDGQYVVVLYLIRVRRGITALTPDDVTDLRDDVDLCGRVLPLSAIAGDVIYIYGFLTGGIDAEVARLVSLSNAVVAKADAAIAQLDAEIQQAGGGAEIGELMTSRHPSSETGWLLCDGEAVPAAYPTLSAMLNGTLPDIPGDRYKTYIFAGAPG